MRDIKVSYKAYAAWEYEKEEKELNAQSEKGWNLVKGGCFHSKFQKDESRRYLYQLDYNTKIEDPMRYREIFAEQGWEYINSTFNGWHYFRKPYREGMEDSECSIYTDRQSLYEMQNRWVRLITVLFGICSVLTGLYMVLGIKMKESSLLIESSIFAIMAIMMGLAVLDTKRRRKGKSLSITIPIQIAFPIIILLFFVAFGILCR